MLTFDAEKHEYKWDGRIVPGVSNIIAPLRDFSGIPEAVLDIKRQWGTTVHLYLAMHDRGTLDPDRSKWDERMIPLIDSWQRFREQFGLTDCAAKIEEKLYSESLRYAGTPDRVYPEVNTVVDIKTSIAPQRSTGVQLAAYARLAEEAGWLFSADKSRLIEVCLLDDGSYKTQIYPFTESFNIFMCCMTIYNWRGK